LGIAVVGSFVADGSAGCRRAGSSPQLTNPADGGGCSLSGNGLEIRLKDMDRKAICAGRVTATRYDLAEELALDFEQCVFTGARGRLGEYAISVLVPGFEPETVEGIIVRLDGCEVMTQKVLIGLPRLSEYDGGALPPPLARIWRPDAGIEYFPDRGATVVVGDPMGSTSITNAPRVLAGMRAGFRACYVRALSVDANLEGSLRIAARVSAEGNVISAKPLVDVRLSAGCLNDELIGCVLRRVEVASFVPPAAGPETLVFPIRFKRDFAQP